MESNIIIQKQEKCSQNMTPVYKVLSEDVINQNLIEVSLEELRRFLLDDNIFPSSYVDKNKTFISFLEIRNIPFNLESMVKYIEHKKLKNRKLLPRLHATENIKCAEYVKNLYLPILRNGAL